MQKPVMIINGPNLNRLGSREPDLYGDNTIESIKSKALSYAEKYCEFSSIWFRQTNSEAELLDWVYDAEDQDYNIIINPGAFTHYSYALSDALKAAKQSGVKIIEIHITNPAAREDFRSKSVVSPVVTGTIAGFGVNSYILALQALNTIND